MSGILNVGAWGNPILPPTEYPPVFPTEYPLLPPIEYPPLPPTVYPPLPPTGYPLLTSVIILTLFCPYRLTSF